MNKYGRGIDFRSASTPEAALRLLLRVRLAEVLERQSALAGEDDDAIHAFRLSCKRLRFAIERSVTQLPQLQKAADLLSGLTDELGASHDSVVLAQRAEKLGASVVVMHARQDRARYLKNARRLWRHAFQDASPLAALAEYAGYSWNAA